MLAPTLPDLDRLDREALKALLVATHERLRSRESEIEHLKLVIAKLRRMQFGRHSEKIQRQIEQLELKLEDLEAKRVADRAQPQNQPRAAAAPPPLKPTRCPLPEHLPRRDAPARTGGESLSRLRWRSAPAGRRRLGDAGVCAWPA